MTNFENIYFNNKIVRKLLNKLIDIVLIIHLAPERDRRFKRKLNKSKAKHKQKLRHIKRSTPQGSMSIIYKSRDGIRKLFRQETKRLNKHTKQGNTKKKKN